MPHLTSLSVAFALLLAGPALAQTSNQSVEKPGDCQAAAEAEPATPPAPGQDSTAPGNAGTSGWTGGLGGSHLGTNPSGKTEDSATWQPPTARGLDLKAAPEPVAKC